MNCKSIYLSLLKSGTVFHFVPDETSPSYSFENYNPLTQLVSFFPLYDIPLTFYIRDIIVYVFDE